jgi:hypothetical protein
VVTAHDLLIRRSRQRRLAEVIRGARTVEIDGAHNAWMVKPIEFATAIDEALNLVMDDLGMETVPLTDEEKATLGPRGVPAAELTPEPA